MNNDNTCPVCGEHSDDSLMCESCVDDYTAMAEHDYEDRYYGEGRYAR